MKKRKIAPLVFLPDHLWTKRKGKILWLRYLLPNIYFFDDEGCKNQQPSKLAQQFFVQQAHHKVYVPIAGTGWLKRRPTKDVLMCFLDMSKPTIVIKKPEAAKFRDQVFDKRGYS